MKAFVITILITIAMFPTNDLMADFYDGNKLYKDCTPNVLLNQGRTDLLNETMWFAVGMCTGNIIGVMGFLSEYGQQISVPQVCLPDTMEAGQAIKVVFKYLEENPEKLHQSAGSLIYAALYKAYSCEREN